MANIDGGGSTIDIAPGYRLAAPGLAGTATARNPRRPGSTDRGPELSTDAYDQAIAATGLTEVMNIDLAVRQVPPPPQAPEFRTVQGEEGLVLETPDLGPEVGQLVLAIDEGGVVSWNFPESPDQKIEPPTVRGAGGTKKFMIRSYPPTQTEQTAETATRGIFGAVGRKILKVLIYPVTDAVLGPVTDHFAAKWETKNRPYKARLFTPADFRNSEVEPMTGDDWRNVAGDRALLFVHGTFSTSHGGFGGLPDATMAELHRRYGGRVFAFNHHTLSHTPEENVAEMAARMPDDVSLEVDIVAHSRGGLVARTLAGELPGVGVPGLSVNRAVFVATPNHGTALADAENIVNFIDRYTSILNVMPPGPLGVVSEILEAIVTVVKVIGHAALTGLGGINSMDPTGDFMSRLNTGPAPATEYYGMAANYEPKGALGSMILKTVTDVVIDRVFADAANDLVVPTLGVSEGSADLAFPIDPGRLLVYDQSRGVQHTSFFSEPDTSSKLLEWLTV